MILIVGAESAAHAASIANNAESAGAVTVSIVRESTMIWHVFLRASDKPEMQAALQSALKRTSRY